MWAWTELNTPVVIFASTSEENIGRRGKLLIVECRPLTLERLAARCVVAVGELTLLARSLL
jgi:hypothetical protein